MKRLGGVILFILLITPLTSKLPPPVDPIPFILDKAKKNDVILFGTTHKQDEILDFLANLIPELTSSGITHIGLEIAVDQQDTVDHYMADSKGLDDIQLLPTIDCPKYRRLIQVIRCTGLKPAAIDLPASKQKIIGSRDEWMARSIVQTLNSDGKAKIFTIVGSIHTLKQVEWLVNKSDNVIRAYLKRMKPGVKAYTIYSCIGCKADERKFRKIIGADTGGFILETKDLDLPFEKLNNLLNAKPLTVEDAVDAVLVYGGRLDP